MNKINVNETLIRCLLELWKDNNRNDLRSC